MAFITKNFIKFAIEISEHPIKPRRPVPFLDHFLKTLIVKHNPNPTLITLNRIASELLLRPRAIISFSPFVVYRGLSDILRSAVFILVDPKLLRGAKNYKDVAKILERGAISLDDMTALIVKHNPHLLASKGTLLPASALGYFKLENAIATAKEPAIQSLPKILTIRAHNIKFPELTPELIDEVFHRYRNIYQIREKLGPYRNIELNLPPKNTPVETLLYHILKSRRG